jgi:hypothetical protein
MFEQIRPDTIRQTSDGSYVFTYARCRPIDTLPIDAEYLEAYSPSGYNGQWYAVRYRVRRSPSRLTNYIQVVDQRELTAEEIAHFKGLIAGQEGRGL